MPQLQSEVGLRGADTGLRMPGLPSARGRGKLRLCPASACQTGLSWSSPPVMEALGSVLQNPGVTCYTTHFGWCRNSLVFPALPRPWQMENSEFRTLQSIQALSQRALLQAYWILPDKNCNSFILRCLQPKGHVLGPAFLPHSQPYQLLLPTNILPSPHPPSGVHKSIHMSLSPLLPCTMYI